MKLDRGHARGVLLLRALSEGKPHLTAWVLICLCFCCTGKEPSAVFSTPTGQKRILLELARTDEERARGLMFRSRMDEDRGMLFVFDEIGRPSFWMKNTYLSLDILFLSPEGTVVDLFEGLSPCPMDPCPLYAPRAPARYVLEVVGGFASRHAVRKGDRVLLENVPGLPPQ